MHSMSALGHRQQMQACAVQAEVASYIEEHATPKEYRQA